LNHHRPRYELTINSDLNSLVFDYLLIEGFSDAAVEFARETGLPHDIDHAMIQERMEIREAVEEGRVEEAVRRVNELDPEVSACSPHHSTPGRTRGPQGYEPSCTTLSRLRQGHAEKPDFTDLI
jgi:hypothetical protein